MRAARGNLSCRAARERDRVGGGGEQDGDDYLDAHNGRAETGGELDPVETIATNELSADTQDVEEPVVSATVEVGAAVKIHLHVQCTADEIDDIAPRLKTLLRELSDP